MPLKGEIEELLEADSTCHLSLLLCLCNEWSSSWSCTHLEIKSNLRRKSFKYFKRKMWLRKWSFQQVLTKMLRFTVSLLSVSVKTVVREWQKTMQQFRRDIWLLRISASSTVKPYSHSAMEVAQDLAANRRKVIYAQGTKTSCQEFSSSSALTTAYARREWSGCLESLKS